MKENVVILAAGFGTRLGNVPKGLVETGGGQTILQRVMDGVRQGLPGAEVAMVTNHLYVARYAAVVPEVIDDGAEVPERRLGAIGDMRLVLDKKGWWESGGVLVLPCDTLFKFSLKDFWTFAAGRGGMTVAVYPQSREEIKGRLGCVVAEGERMVGFEEKPVVPQGDLAIAPIYFYSKEALDVLRGYQGPGDAPSMIIPEFLSKKIPVWVYRTEGVVDVGRPEDLEKAKAFNS